MDRVIWYGLETLRSFDLLWGPKDSFTGLAWAAQDTHGSSLTVASGFTATPTSPTSLAVNLTAGRLYQMAAADPTAYGSLPPDAVQVKVQGWAAAQQQLLSTSGLSVGQSRWALIQVSLSQGDVVRAGDPTGGVLNFWDVTNPTVPFVGPGNDQLPLATVRQNTALVTVVYGSVATTGSEIPPTPSGGCQPLYLIDLTFGQVTVTAPQILVAGPSVGTGVPTNYPYAPLLAGLLNSHHGGTPGQAPKVNLATEVQGVLPYPNMSPVRTLLTANQTIFVNPTTGLDTNNGLTAGTAFKTIQAAVNAVYRQYDYNGFSCTIQMANGLYNIVSPNGAGVVFNGLPVGMPTASLTLLGNVASPGSVSIVVTNGNGVAAQNAAWVQVSGFTVTASGNINSPSSAQGYGIASTTGSLVGVSNVVIGACGGAQLRAQTGGTLVVDGPVAVTGSTPATLSADQGLIWTLGMPVTVTGLATTAFAAAVNCGVITASGMTTIGSGTGARYNVQANAVVNTGGGGPTFFLPSGGSAGGTANGGLYL